ncbi:DUF4439 domain-containing protein [Arthrobacter sp. NPDC055585]
MEKPPNPPQPPAARPSRAAAAAGFLRRTLALGLLACVVASLGLTAGTQVEPERPKSFSEQALNEAFATSRVLAAEAESLAASLRGASAAAVQETADTLNQQALLLTSPGGAAALQKAEGINGRSLPQALADSARKNLAAAGRADHGTARLLASTGTGQLLLALRTAPALGESPGQVPESGWTPVLNDAAQDRCGGSGGSVADGEPDAAASLQAVLDAEFGAAYAYEVAEAQYGAGFTVLGQRPAERREAHLEAGGEGAGLLPALCLPEAAPVPAYSLAPEFLSDPLGSLSLLEENMPTLYADLAGSSDGAVRSWAIDRLVASSVLLYAGAADIPASPGLDADPAALPWTSG